MKFLLTTLISLIVCLASAAPLPITYTGKFVGDGTLVTNVFTTNLVALYDRVDTNALWVTGGAADGNPGADGKYTWTLGQHSYVNANLWGIYIDTVTVFPTVQLSVTNSSGTIIYDDCGGSLIFAFATPALAATGEFWGAAGTCNGDNPILTVWNTNHVGPIDAPLLLDNGVNLTNLNPQIIIAGLGTNAYAVTNLPSTDWLFNPPTVGPSKVFNWRNASAEIPASTEGIAYLGANQSGIIRNLWFGTFYGTDGLQSATNKYLRVYCDAGTIADFTTVSTNFLRVNVDLATLLCGQYQAAALSLTRGSRWMDVQRFVQGGNNYFSVSLKLPIFFTNGVFACIWTNGTPNGAATYPRTTQGFYTTTYELGTLTSPYYKWRLCGTNTYNQHYATGADFINVMDSRNEGVLAAVCVACGGNAGGNWPEGTWRIWKNSIANANLMWESGGGEDLFLAPFYFITSTNYNWDSGITFYSQATTKVSAYRMFQGDAPRWTIHSILGTAPQNCTDTEFSTVVLWYSYP